MGENIECLLTLNLSIDREKRPFYNFIATVSDEDGLFSNANINLEILDVNDNPPKFSRSGNFSKQCWRHDFSN